MVLHLYIDLCNEHESCDSNLLFHSENLYKRISTIG